MPLSGISGLSLDHAIFSCSGVAEHGDERFIVYLEELAHSLPGGRSQAALSLLGWITSRRLYQRIFQSRTRSATRGISAEDRTRSARSGVTPKKRKHFWNE